MATKQKSGTVAALQAELAKIQAQLAEITQDGFTVTAAMVKRFTADHFKALRYSLVVHDGEKLVLAKGRKGYALVKGADVKWYMALKGFETTLRARERDGETPELSDEPNAKGRSQILYAQETLSAMVNAGFIDENSALLKGENGKPKVGRPRKTS